MTDNTENTRPVWRYLTSSHGLILLTYTAGFAVLALVTALLVSYIATREAEKVLISEGKGFAQLAAQSAVIPLLTGAKENSNDYLGPLISYQNIHHISVYDRDFRKFYQAGNEPAWTPPRDMLEHVQGVALIHEDKGYWYIVAPVLIEGVVGKPIGNIFTVITKTTINTLGRNILTYTIWICSIAAFVLWIMLYLVLRRVTLPIQRIAGFMDLSKGTSKRYRTPDHVPSDVKTIYNAFNTMLDQIDERNQELKDHVNSMENIVMEKTQNLTDKNVQLEDAYNQAVAASHAKDIFVANVSHELRTPIQAIMGNCELLSGKYDDKELAKITISSKQLLNLVNDILDLSKIEHDKFEINLKTIRVRDVVTEAAQAILPIINANDNVFEIKIDDDVGDITTDSEMLVQIINNLLSNAGRYTREGLVTLGVSIKDNAGSKMICFEVSDTGIGIDKSKLDKIFQPFEQADMSKTRIHGGTGLGLTISQKLATMLGGTLAVESEIGIGSKFFLCIPQGECIKEGVEGDNPPGNPVQQVEHKILLAEDHPFISDAVKQLLENDGHKVSVAQDGNKALYMLGNEAFDIALIDVHMPKIEGTEVIRRYQESHPHHNIKIFLLTADATEALRQQAHDLGVKIIQKPFSRAQLAEKIAE